MKIYDCFSYLDEDLLLDLRLNILDEYVDYFVIVEGNKTWQNNPKELKFNIQKETIDAIEYLYAKEDNTGYIFIYDFNGTNISDPLCSSNVGKNLYDFKDKNGVKVIKSLIDISKNTDIETLIAYVSHTTGVLLNVYTNAIANKQKDKVSAKQETKKKKVEPIAKRKELKGDDFYDVKTIGNLTVAIVCDGVGSAAEGAVAAKRVVTHIMTNFKNRPLSWSIEKSIKSFIESINAILYQESMLNYERSELVTTLTIVVIEGNRLYGANVGDSRVYLHRNKQLNQLSTDHAMDEKGFENVLTQAIGISDKVEPYYFENILQKDDTILLCSDGLYNILDNETIGSNLLLGATSLVKKASKIVASSSSIFDFGKNCLKPRFLPLRI